MCMLYIESWILNSYFSQLQNEFNQRIQNYRLQTNPQIHIETIDDSCKQFSAEKAAGRFVTELMIKVLCEQQKPINIPDAEKTELIKGFVQKKRNKKRGRFGDDVDYLDFAQKYGTSRRSFGQIKFGLYRVRIKEGNVTSHKYDLLQLLDLNKKTQITL
ncbi:Hypothetical_protein [Hexamita inflata]|uniref:Hypothetical_protein n=1 Tax=Hexamita inflata TaxID=28002 RepID=A0AA86TRA3_9EUKA|nr:Hypothetical protein HINF_LOCUS13035 [Hexamita inflata]